MPERDSPLPRFIAELRIVMSEEFTQYELRDIGWYKFINGLDAESAKSPLELACKAFIDTTMSPEVDPQENDYATRIATVIFAYLFSQYGRIVSREQGKELTRRWLHQRAVSAGTAPIRKWFDEVYGNEEWPRKPKLF